MHRHQCLGPNSFTCAAVVLAGLLCAVAAVGGDRPAGRDDGTTASRPNEVVVMGMIHGGHRKSELYSLDRVREIIRAVEPDYVLCEIPPDRFEQAMTGFRETGEVTEERVKVFPEYVDVLFPLTREISFEIVPCAGWTRAMADDRTAKLSRWKVERANEYTEMRRAQAEASETLDELGISEDPWGIHSDRYGEIVRKGMEPYDRLFNDDLGPGGWTNINKIFIELKIILKYFGG